MGKIPQYQRNKFASTYVGAPQVDRSGEIAVKGIGGLVDTTTDIAAKKMRAKELARIDAQADNALIDYQLSLQKQLKAAEKEYADNPQGFVDAAQKAGQDLQSAYLKNISDDRVKTRFGEAARQVIKKTSLDAIEWATVKEEENGLIAAQKVIDKRALLVSQSSSPEELAYNIMATESEIKKYPGVDAKEAVKMLPDMIDSYMYLQARDNPDQLEKDLNDPEGPYSEIPYFDKDMKQKYLDRIRTRRRQQEQDLRDVQTDNFNQVTDEIFDRKSSFEALFARIEEVRESLPNREGLRDRDYTRLKKALFNKVNARVKTMKDETTKADQYIKAINDLTEGDIDKTKRAAVLLDMYEDGFSGQELKTLNDMYNIRTAGGAVKEAFMTGLQVLRQVYSADTISQGEYAKSLAQKIVGGQDPDKAVKEVTQQAINNKAVKVDPSVASSDKPTEQMYRNEAVRILKRDGQPVRPENIQWMIEQLKEAEGLNANR